MCHHCIVGFVVLVTFNNVLHHSGFLCILNAPKIKFTTNHMKLFGRTLPTQYQRCLLQLHLSSKMLLYYLSRRSNFNAKVGREGHASCEAADKANAKTFFGSGGMLVLVSVIVNVVF